MDTGVVGARRGGVQRSGGDAEATVTRGAAVRWRRRSQWVFPSLVALSLDRVRFSYWWVMAAPVNLVVRALISTYLYSAVQQGPTNHIRIGRPRSGRRSKGLGLLVEIN